MRIEVFSLKIIKKCGFINSYFMKALYFLIFLCYNKLVTESSIMEGKMEVTDVRVRLVASDSRLRGVVTVTFDDCFVVHDIRVIEGDNGIFVAMPSKKMSNGGYRDIAHPIRQEIRVVIEEAIVKAYNEALQSQTPEETGD